MARRSRNFKIGWELVNSKRHSDFDPDEWWIARHEAAHFFTAAHLGIGVHSVWLQTKKSRSHHLLGKGAAGGVLTLPVDDRANIICGLAGPEADLMIKGQTWCSTDQGYKAETDKAVAEIKAAMRDIWAKGIYIDFEHHATDDEAREALRPLISEAHDILVRHWGDIEFIAKAFLIYRTEGTGVVHTSRVDKLYTMAKHLSQGWTIDQWIASASSETRPKNHESRKPTRRVSDRYR